jgi:hypothetical protein
MKMQPVYLTAVSSGSTPWHLANWHATGPQQFGFAVLSTGGSSWTIDVALEDPSGTYPSPNSSTATAFSLLAGSSNQLLGLSSIAIAAFRLSLNVPSSAGAKVTLAAIQSGIG